MGGPHYKYNSTGPDAGDNMCVLSWRSSCSWAQYCSLGCSVLAFPKCVWVAIFTSTDEVICVFCFRFSFNLTFDGKDKFQQTSTKRQYLAGGWWLFQHGLIILVHFCWSIIRTWITDYDRATSIVLHEPEATSNGFSPVSSIKGAKFACCNLQPKLPDLPDQWSATIEANFIGDGKSYSMLRKEWYDKVKGKVRVNEHSAWAKLVHLMDVDGSEMKTLHKNETFPSGHCTQTTSLGRRECCTCLKSFIQHATYFSAPLLF